MANCPAKLSNKCSRSCSSKQDVSLLQHSIMYGRLALSLIAQQLGGARITTKCSQILKVSLPDLRSYELAAGHICSCRIVFDGIALTGMICKIPNKALQCTNCCCCLRHHQSFEPGTFMLCIVAASSFLRVLCQCGCAPHPYCQH